MPITRKVVHQFSIRNESGDRDTFVRREIDMVLRWYPPCSDPIADPKKPNQTVNPPGIRALHDLNDGNYITPERLMAILDYLDDASDWYSDPEAESSLEPYEGRNAEAIGDMEALKATIRLAL